MRETEIFKISTYHNVNIIDFVPCLKSGIICMFSLCESVCLHCRAGEKIPVSEIINLGLNLASFWLHFILVFGC